MRKPVTVLLKDRSYCLKGEHSQDMAKAKVSGVRFITVTTDCCEMPQTFELDLNEVVWAFDHGAKVIDDEAEPKSNVIPFSSLTRRQTTLL